ncbi:GNAT family N-acetyltransferase [Paenibacillus sp. N3.4]|uniref:GNAT family N-acetyltransferase n=1 Tax=Paenibacillus sp. N3.4 TaxID=2603222 RepID=UPI0011C8CA4D|nr:GNAT family N-acetyltransferase [Paenibacillus sp. N3.4]TXK85358.1 GNAT family N-acetyltransferase [Paenibacillus sp. N3.4]
MSEASPLFITLDTIAAHTWPAESVDYVDNWLLRSSQGVTRRANSVLAIGDFPKDADWLAQIELYYQKRGLPAVIQVSAASPENLDEQLSAAGYALETPCLLMTADSQEVVDRTAISLAKRENTDIQIEWTPEAAEEWLDAFLRLEQFPEERRSFYLHLFERMPISKGFFTLSQHGKMIALGTAIVEKQWSGFVNVVVHEEHRGKGLGYMLMHAMTSWSMKQGATQQYLQVITSNAAAVALYGKLGYTTCYGYHYRIKYDL